MKMAERGERGGGEVREMVERNGGGVVGTAAYGRLRARRWVNPDVYENMSKKTLA